MKRVYAIEENCLNCRLCEVACKTAHSKSGDTFKAYMLEDALPGRVHVEGTNTLSIAINCRHCNQPKCVSGCIAGALSKDPKTGVVSCDTNKCVGCRTCMTMCPYDAIRIIERAHKCDLCTTGYGNGQPACVEACINGALVFAESDEEAVIEVEKKMRGKAVK